jgi:hypothetical protein
MLGRVPAVGDTVDVTGLRLTVLTVEGRRIGTVRVRRLPNDESGQKNSTREKETTTAPKSSSTLVSNPRKAPSGS